MKHSRNPYELNRFEKSFMNHKTAPNPEPTHVHAGFRIEIIHERNTNQKIETWWKN